MLRMVGGRPGRRRVLVSYFRATSLRCQASSVAGVTGKTRAHCRRGMNEASAANQARSAGSFRIRSAFQRSTVFSCRSTSSSASFARFPRSISTTSSNSRRISRYEIFRATRPANHHRIRPAVDTSGQADDRVFGGTGRHEQVRGVVVQIGYTTHVANGSSSHSACAASWRCFPSSRAPARRPAVLPNGLPPASEPGKSRRTVIQRVCPRPSSARRHQHGPAEGLAGELHAQALPHQYRVWTLASRLVRQTSTR